MPRPTKKDLEARAAAIKKGKTRYTRPSDNQEWVIRNLDNPRLQRRFGGQGGTDEQATMRKSNRGSETRRAVTNEQSLTRQDYLNYAKKNGYSAEQANQLFEKNEARLANYRGQKSSELHYEHLAPTRSPMRGGVEHYRNIVMMQGELNIDKSDKLASTAAMRKAGVPLTKQGALYADFNNLPLPTDQQQINIILKDIASQSKPKTTKDVRKALTRNPAVKQVGEKFRLIDRYSPAQRRRLNAAPTLEAKESLLREFNSMPITSIGGSPLSPLNRGSAAYGGIETQTNEQLGNFPGVSAVQASFGLAN